MKKYLDEMTKEELIHLAMQECVLLELTFDKEKIMKKRFVRMKKMKI